MTFVREIPGGAFEAERPAVGGAAAGGAGGARETTMGAGCSEGRGRGAGRLAERLWKRGGELLVVTDGLEPLLFWRSRNVNRGGGCFSLQGRQEAGDLPGLHLEISSCLESLPALPHLASYHLTC